MVEVTRTVGKVRENEKILLVERSSWTRSGLVGKCVLSVAKPDQAREDLFLGEELRLGRVKIEIHEPEGKRNMSGKAITRYYLYYPGTCNLDLNESKRNTFATKAFINI